MDARATLCVFKVFESELLSKVFQMETVEQLRQMKNKTQKKKESKHRHSQAFSKVGENLQSAMGC